MVSRRLVQEILLFVAAVALTLAVVQSDAPEVLTALRDLPVLQIN